VKVPKAPKPAVREPKPEPKPVVSIKQDPYRSEWFVIAVRGKTSVTLAAPEGEREATAMTKSLNKFGWFAYPTINSVPRDDPRFHQIARETAGARKQGTI
jgi:hypothetical protein